MINWKQYYHFLRFPSISSEPAHRDALLACAAWLEGHLKNIGFTTELWPTAHHPVLFASYIKDPQLPTLLIYNHYDVQPVDPLELWHNPPFEPIEHEGNIYARGAQDNKGQCFYVLEALRLLLEKNHSLPINIKLCIEGEEECGSQGLLSILETKAPSLKADWLAVVDVGIPGPEEPAITLGTRGLITFDCTLQGASSDLHSGCHGGLAPNPLQGLVKLLSSLHDASGRVTVPDFYKEVATIPKELHEQAKHFDSKSYQALFAVSPIGGELDFLPLERLWLRPTLEINGIWGGYTGEGFKTVIPARAHAKFSCRLVPNQDPSTLGERVRDYLLQQTPPGLTLSVHLHEGRGAAVRCPPDSKVAQAFAQAFSEIFQQPCRYILEGASIPVVPALAEASGATPLFIGLALATDQIHAPNEHFSKERIEKGVRIMMRGLEILGDV